MLASKFGMEWKIGHRLMKAHLLGEDRMELCRLHSSQTPKFQKWRKNIWRNILFINIVCSWVCVSSQTNNLLVRILSKHDIQYNNVTITINIKMCRHLQAVLAILYTWSVSWMLWCRIYTKILFFNGLIKLPCFRHMLVIY